MSDETLRIRPATEADDAATGDLLVESFVVQYAKKMPEVVVSEERKRELRAVAERRATARVLVAEMEGLVAGTTTVFAPGDHRSKTRDPEAAEMRFMAVGLAFVGQNIAKRLLDAAIAEAGKLGAKRLVLHVRRGATGVGKFYEQNGFERNPADDCDLPDIFLEAYRKNIGKPQPGT